MYIIKPSFEILTPKSILSLVNKNIESAARLCYKSEDKITEGSALGMVRMLIDRGHEAMIEHSGSISVKFIVDRGVSHEIVRHRVASFAQESTRYCNYGADKFGGVTFIKPFFFEEGTQQYSAWKYGCEVSEGMYIGLLKLGATPQEARSVLNNSTKTEIIVTANVREWRHIFKLRTPSTAHPQMREIMIPTLKEFQMLIPVVFDDIRSDY